ncbi:MAG: hypothetical protein QXZ28_01950 [Candidatus Methanomethylicaceae archaeon]
MVTVIIGIIGLIAPHMLSFFKKNDFDKNKSEYIDKKIFIRLELLKIINKDEDIMHKNQLIEFYEDTIYKINHLNCIFDQINLKIMELKKSILAISIWIIILASIPILYSWIMMPIDFNCILSFWLALLIAFILWSIMSYRGYLKDRNCYLSLKKDIENRYERILLTGGNQNERE